MTLARRSARPLAIVRLGLAPVGERATGEAGRAAARPRRTNRRRTRRVLAQGQIIELVTTADVDGLKKLVTEDPSQADFVGRAT